MLEEKVKEVIRSETDRWRLCASAENRPPGGGTETGCQSTPSDGNL